MAHEMAEEFGLKSFSAEGEAQGGMGGGGGAGGGMKYPILYLPECRPPEVVEAEAEEEALAAEAERRRAEEAAALAAAAAAKAPAAKAGKGAGGGGGKSGKAAPTKDALAAQAVKVVPMFERRDKRSIVEIQEEIQNRKRQRVEGPTASTAQE